MTLDNSYRQRFRKGQQIGNYQLLELIGQGGSSVVWKASDPNGKVFAIKIFSPDKGMDSAGINLFKLEFAKTVNLDHPNIIKPLEYGDVGGSPYILLPLCDRSLMTTLKERIYKINTSRVSQDYVFEEEELAYIIADVANALHYLHEKGTVHQDIKPDNILVQDSGKDQKYLISDFGVSTKIKKTILQETLTIQNQKTGLSPDYAAPEMFKGDVKYKSDIFSLGVTIYELASGRMPSKSNTISTGEMLMNGGVIANLPESFSSRFNSLIQSMLSFEPTKRPDGDEIYQMTTHFINEGFWPAWIDKIKTPRFEKVKFMKAAGLLGLLLFLGVTLRMFLRGDTVDLNVKKQDFAVAYSLAKEKGDENTLDLLSLRDSLISTLKVIDDYYIFTSKSNLQGIYKSNGKIMTAALFDKIYPFTDSNLILVEKGKYCGYIDVNGKIVVPINRASCANFRGNISLDDFLNTLK